MNTTTSITTRNNGTSSQDRLRNRVSRALRPVMSKPFALSLAWAMCSALGATSVQAFTAKQRVLVAGVLADGMVICDGEQSYVVSETELAMLIDEVERLC
jgi:hypothetical protein